MPPSRTIVDKLVNIDPLAHRVALRHREALRCRRASTRVEYSTAGNIDAVAVIRLLEPSFGPLLKLTFRPTSTSTPNIVAFDAVSPKNQLVCGRVVLHATVAVNTILSWGEVLVDEVEIPF